jgi:PAS domain S-box-containing protein
VELVRPQRYTVHAAPGTRGRTVVAATIVGLGAFIVLAIHDVIIANAESAIAGLISDFVISAAIGFLLYLYQQRGNELREYQKWIQSVERVAVLMLDHNGRIIECNRGAEKLTGYGRKELLGQPLEICYSGEGGSSGRANDAIRLAATNGSHEDQDWCLRRDGARYWAGIVLTALYDKEGRLKGFAHMLRDSTLQKIAEDQASDHAALLDTIVNGTFDVIYLKNADLRYELINAAGLIFIGKGRKEIVGKTDLDLFPEAVAQRQQQVDREVLERGIVHTYEDRLEARGIRRTFLLHKAPWRDAEGRIVGVIGIATDITDRKPCPVPHEAAA